MSEPLPDVLTSAAVGATPWSPGSGSTQQHEPAGDLVCSTRRCRAHAVWALRWNNPKLHTPERRKTWLACDEHRQYLTEFLTLRGFLRETQPVVRPGTVPKS